MSTAPHVDAAVEAEMLGQELTPQEERDALEREVRRNFNISLDEFECRWRNGAYRDSDDPRISSVASLLR